MYPHAFRNVPVASGKLLGSVAIKPSRVKRKAVAAAYSVGEFGSGGGMYQGETFYAGFQEYGWLARPRNQRRGAKAFAITKVRGRHYMKNALEASAPDALAAMQAGLVQGLASACNDIAKAQRLAISKAKAFNRSSFLK